MIGGSWLEFKLFERLEEEYSVFGEKGLLSVSFVPEVLVGRGREEEYFARILTLGVRDGFLPPMVRVFGRPGSGKTVVVRSVLERFEDYRGDVFRHFYVNLKSCRTVFSAGNAVLSAICGRSLSVNLGLDRVFMEIWSELRGLKEAGVSFVCVVFDEVDSIFLDRHYDPSDFFYRFLRHRIYLGDYDVELCLVVITNNPMILEDNLDARVRSSMGSEVIVFPPYSKNELVEILNSRIGGAFKEGVLEEGVVDLCAQIVTEKSGDARRVLDLLRLSGEVANERRSKVDVDCVKEGLERVETDWVNEQLRDLPLYSAVVLGFIAYLSILRNTFSTRELYEVYTKMRMEGKDIRILGERRVSEIVSELENIGLVSTWNVSRGRYGYRKEIKINVDPRGVLDFFNEGDVKIGFSFEKV